MRPPQRVVDNGEIKQTLTGILFHVASTYDLDTLPDIQQWFEENYSIQFRNYPVGDEYLHDHEVVATHGRDALASGPTRSRKA